MAAVSRLFDWRMALVVVKPDTPDPLAPQRIPAVLALEVQADRTTAAAQGPPTIDPKDDRRKSDVGEERIANELMLKLSIRVSPRTVSKCLCIGGPVRTPDPTSVG